MNKMPRYFSAYLFLMLFCGLSAMSSGVCAASPTDNLSRRIATELDSLLTDDLFTRSQVGLYVYDLTADKPIFEHNTRQLMRPASNQKVLTAITALSALGGNYRLRTTLHFTGSVKDSVLHGDLCLRGGFDPCFGRDNLSALMQVLVDSGVRRIEGDILFDVSLKDTLRWGAGWCWDDENPTLTPLLFEGRDSLAQAFLSTLADSGICVSGNVRREMLPDSARQVAEQSHGIDAVLLTMMKDSDNLYAESLFYHLAARSGKPYADAKQAAAQVGAIIRRVGLNPADYRIADGSGLSLYNYATPELLVRFLRYAWRNKFIYNHLKPALPIAGKDGTLKRRMRKTSAAGAVFAKTGSVTGVSTLSGYTTAANGHQLCFAIMNQGVRRGVDGRDFQDSVCRILTKK